MEQLQQIGKYLQDYGTEHTLQTNAMQQNLETIWNIINEREDKRKIENQAISSLQDELRLLEDDLGKLKRQENETLILQERVSQLTSEANALKVQIKTINDAWQQKFDSLQSSSTDVQNKATAKFMTDLKSLQDQLQSKTDELEQIQQSSLEQGNKILELQTALEQLQREKGKLEEEQKRLTDELSSLRSTGVADQTTIAELQKKLGEITRANKSLNDQIDQVSSQMQAEQKATAENERILNDNISSLNQRIQAITSNALQEDEKLGRNIKAIAEFESTSKKRRIDDIITTITQQKGTNNETPLQSAKNWIRQNQISLGLSNDGTVNKFLNDATATDATKSSVAQALFNAKANKPGDVQLSIDNVINILYPGFKPVLPSRTRSGQKNGGRRSRIHRVTRRPRRPGSRKGKPSSRRRKAARPTRRARKTRRHAR